MSNQVNSGGVVPIPGNDELFDFDPISIKPGFLSDIKALKKRQWIIEKHLLRGYIALTVSPGGVGKSTFELTKAVSVATGRDILGLGVSERCNALVINNEDDESEIKRRLAAVMIGHDIKEEELEDRLHIFSGYGTPLLVAIRFHDGTIVAAPHMEKLTGFIKANNIGAVFIDPFVSTHSVNENDNSAINQVVEQYKKLALNTRCGLSLVHHTSKQGKNSENHAGDAESGRGASSLKDAARSVDTLSKMTESTANRLGIPIDERNRFIRLDVGKLNFQLADAEAKWFWMGSAVIPNGDEVGTIRPVNMAPYFDQAKSNDGRVKWTDTSVAKALHRIIQSDETKFKDIQDQFEQENNVKDRQARDLIKKISDKETCATRIEVNGERFEYWYSKANQTAPIVVHRKKL